jgi:hypothetical protein
MREEEGREGGGRREEGGEGRRREEGGRKEEERGRRREEGWMDCRAAVLFLPHPPIYGLISLFFENDGFVVIGIEGN